MNTLNDEKLYLDRFSILLAFLALGFSLLYLLPTQPGAAQFNLFGITFGFGFFDLIPLALAFLAAVGAIWVFISNPRWQNEKVSLIKLLPHLTLPFITTLILAIVLQQSARSSIWWVVLLVGYLILFFLLRAEYVLVGEGQGGQIGYAIMIISFSYGTFLILTISLKNSDIRMVAQTGMIFLAAYFVTFRNLTIRQRIKSKTAQSLTVSVLITELAVALHYLFINPIQYGLVLTGVMYAISSWIHLYDKNKKWHTYKEPFLMLVATAIILFLSSIY